MEDFSVLNDLYYGQQRTERSRDKSCLDLYVPFSVDAHKLKLPHSSTRNRDNKESISDHQRYESSSTVPLVIFAHGGGWRRGGRKVWKHFLSCEDTNIVAAFLTWYYNLYSNVGECLASSGIACAVISYPLGSAKLPQMIFEMMTSFVAGVFVCTLISSVILTLMCFLGILGSSLVAFIGVGIISYNSLVIVLFATRSREYRLENWEVFSIWVLYFGALSQLIYIVETDSRLYLVAILTSILSQGVLLIKRMTLPRVNHEHQTKSIVSTIEWAKSLLHENTCFEDIFLMGHSAGGHLTSLVTLDNYLFQNVGNSQTVIKGVISICGVYDLNNLSSRFLKQFYLTPVFGEKASVWHKASPLTHAKMAAKRGENSPRPAYLLINAEYDLHLVKDTKDMIEEFSQDDVSYRHVTIQGTTHFSIMNLFQKNNSDNVLVEACRTFIRDVQSGRM
ncbi:uncharacterized protein LOC126819711 [Patella vulgata]|uniref:uncharacterized protein LOC126819711 n=1 Tax=Patella vulgata TaxID=6465 RepID=UPI0024A82934|nr:uncharacterized protein LOC126819711 [Patella vulgata]